MATLKELLIATTSNGFFNFNFVGRNIRYISFFMTGDTIKIAELTIRQTKEQPFCNGVYVGL
jgi:hypothetical protein